MNRSRRHKHIGRGRNVFRWSPVTPNFRRKRLRPRICPPRDDDTFGYTEDYRGEEEPVRRVTLGNPNIAPPEPPATWNGFIRTETKPPIYFVPKIPFDFSKARQQRTTSPMRSLELEDISSSDELAYRNDRKMGKSTLQITIYTGVGKSPVKEEVSPKLDVSDDMLADPNFTDDDDVGDLQVTVYFSSPARQEAESPQNDSVLCTPPDNQPPKSPRDQSKDAEKMEIDKNDIDYAIEEILDS